jgi:cytochrome c peroxidase
LLLKTHIYNRNYLGLLSLIGAFIFIFPSCRKDSGTVSPAEPVALEIPRFFPTRLNIPADNPLTKEGIALGRFLFYDGRLSGRTAPDSMMTCATCHLQSHAFECGIDHPKYTGGFTFGITGIRTPHVMLSMQNLVWNESGYLWNGSVYAANPRVNSRNIEDIVMMGVLAPHEMQGDTNKTRKLFQQIKGYPELFEKAFGSRTVTMRNISKAIAQFVRTLVSSDSKFDRYLRGEEQLSDQELSGYVLFTTENGGDCFHCHGGSGNPLFTTNLFYNNGKDMVFTDSRDRYAVTGDPADIGAYRAPTLRNIEFTGPYMHDGRFKTIDEVINFYSEQLVKSPYVHPLMHHLNEGGVHLTPSGKADLKAFLFALSDNTFITNPAYARPAVFPDGSR